MTSKLLDLTKIVVKTFVPAKVSQEVWNQYHELNEELSLELYPDDPLPKHEVVVGELCYEDPDFNETKWLIYKDESEKELIAFCAFEYYKDTFPKYEEHKENSYFEIKIRNEFRRKGLGTKLLKEIISHLENAGCKYSTTKTKYPSGFSFSEKLGGKIINKMTENRLDFKNVDWNQVETWIREGEKRNPEVKLESFFGVSEINIEEYAEILTELMSEVPTLEEDEERDKEIITPNRFREYVQFLARKKYKLFTLRTIESDGKVSGLTEIRFSDINNPEIIEQALTGVRSIHRGRGLGKWLKAAMLVYIRESFPKAKHFITGNANHNAPMLSINNRLGFKPYRQRRSYKFVINNLKKKIE